MIVVMAGATGLVGSVLLKKILDDDAFSLVIVVGRKSTGLKSSKLKEILVKDLIQISQIKDQLKGDIYISCLGTTIKAAGTKENFRKIDYVAVMDFARIANENKSQLFMTISAYGANARSRFFYNQVKGQLELDLSELPLNRLVILYPSLLIGEREEFRLGEKLAIKSFKILSSALPLKLKKKLGTDVNQLATRMIQEAKISKPGKFLIGPQDI